MKKPIQKYPFKEEHMVDTIGRGVKLNRCKICGAYIADHKQHLRWHNVLNGVLNGLLVGDANAHR